MATEIYSTSNTQKLSIKQLCTPPDRPKLPIIKIDELKKHDKNESRIWVNFKEVILFLIYFNFIVFELYSLCISI